MKRYIYILIGVLLAGQTAFAQEEMMDMLKGNRQYSDSAYADAELQYRKGVDRNNDSFEAHYNLGNALYQQQKFDEAVAEYNQAAQIMKKGNEELSNKQKTKLAAAYHNTGNAKYAAQDYGGAAQAYQQALKLTPKDDETRYNMLKAMRMMQQQQQQQNNNDNEDDNDKQEQQQQQQQQQEQQEQQQQQEQNPDMDKEKAEEILQALQQDEQDTQDKANRQQMNSKFRTDKDW